MLQVLLAQFPTQINRETILTNREFLSRNRESKRIIGVRICLLGLSAPAEEAGHEPRWAIGSNTLPAASQIAAIGDPND